MFKVRSHGSQVRRPESKTKAVESNTQDSQPKVLDQRELVKVVGGVSTSLPKRGW